MSDPVLAFTHALTEAMSEPPKPGEPEERTTDSVLKAMLTENTGRHMLDSGGAYGRNWERNQRVEFESQPDMEIDWRWDYIDVTANLYPVLREVLEYEADGDWLFEQWAKTGDREREPWLPLMERFVEEIIPTARGLYRDGSPMLVNTYNGESWLSQVLQYAYFEIEDDVSLCIPEVSTEEVVVLTAGAYVLLQIHGGCDVRGGYTQPRLFEVDPDEFLYAGEQVFIGCDSCEARWFGRCGDCFEPEDAEEDLHEYPTLDLTKPGNFSAWTARNIVREVLDHSGDDEFQTLMEENFPVLGRAYYGYPTEHNVSYCPECGTGVLQGGGI